MICLWIIETPLEAKFETSLLPYIYQNFFPVDPTSRRRRDPNAFAPEESKIEVGSTLPPVPHLTKGMRRFRHRELEYL